MFGCVFCCASGEIDFSHVVIHSFGVSLGGLILGIPKKETRMTQLNFRMRSIWKSAGRISNDVSQLTWHRIYMSRVYMEKVVIVLEYDVIQSEWMHGASEIVVLILRNSMRRRKSEFMMTPKRAVQIFISEWMWIASNDSSFLINNNIQEKFVQFLEKRACV